MESLLQVRRSNRIRSVLPAVGLAATVLALVLVISGLLSTAGGPKRRVLDVSLVPEVPPIEKPPQKPPEPEVRKEQIKLPEAEPPPQAAKPERPPASDRLGLDTDKTGSADGFGLEAHKGGRDVTLGEGGGLGRPDIRWYVGVLQDHFNEELNKNQQLREAGYRAELRVWLAESGSVQRVELVRGTGDHKIDELLRQALSAMSPLPRPPPADMAQPVRIRITSHGAS